MWRLYLEFCYCLSMLFSRLSTDFFLFENINYNRNTSVSFFFFVIKWCVNTNQLWQNYENPMAAAQEVFLPCRKLRCNRRGNPSETIEMTHRAMCYNDLLGNSTKEVPRSLLKWQMLLRKCWYFSKLKILICFQWKASPRFAAIILPLTLCNKEIIFHSFPAPALCQTESYQRKVENVSVILIAPYIYLCSIYLINISLI